MDKTRLIAALRLTADRIESKDYPYKWSDAALCNCGLLAATLLDMRPEALQERFVEILCASREQYGKESRSLSAWDVMAVDYDKGEPWICINSGLTMKAVFDALYADGLTKKDIVQLEWLNNPLICERAGLEEGASISDFFYKPGPVIRYMRAWADFLEETNEPDSDSPVSLES